MFHALSSRASMNLSHPARFTQPHSSEHLATTDCTSNSGQCPWMSWAPFFGFDCESFQESIA